MNNELMPVQEITTIAKAFIESGMFLDTKTMAQAIVKIQAGQEVGIKPFAAMTGIHIIMGKPVIGSGIIASRIKASGKYDYKVKLMTDKVCSIEFYQGKEMIGVSDFTIEEARKAQTKNIEKFPKNMLFARAISNGVKFFCPDVFDGPVYVPEEMNETIEVTAEPAQQQSAGIKPDFITPVKFELTTTEAKEKLSEAKSLDELKRVYLSLSKEMQAATTDFKNQLKDKLTQAA